MKVRLRRMGRAEAGIVWIVGAPKIHIKEVLIDTN